MSLTIANFGDLHLQNIDFDPFLINRFGRVACAIKFHCQFGNQKITRGLTAYPNEAEPAKFGKMEHALRYLVTHGKAIALPFGQNYDLGNIQPVVGPIKAYELKDNDDPWHPERIRHYRFLYKQAIMLSPNQYWYDISAVYRNSKYNAPGSFNSSDPCRIWFSFEGRDQSGARLSIFNEADIESAIQIGASYESH